MTGKWIKFIGGDFTFARAICLKIQIINHAFLTLITVYLVRNFVLYGVKRKYSLDISFLYILFSKDIGNFCSRLSFQECLYSEQLGKIEIVYPSRRRLRTFATYYNNYNVSLWGKIYASLLKAKYKKIMDP